jgi:phenylalanyl-tRNA synthetase alpha chain
MSSTEKSQGEQSANREVDLEQLLLDILANEGEIQDSWVFCQQHKVDHQALIGVLKSLLVDQYATESPLSNTFWVLTQEGKTVLASGSAEVQVFNAVPEEGILVSELSTKLGEVVKIGMGVCMKNKWLRKEGEKIVRVCKTVEDETQQLLSVVESSTPPSEEVLKNLKKRKLVDVVTRKAYKISKGPEYRQKRVKKVADLTKAMLGDKNEVKIPLLQQKLITLSSIV